ncbi:MAG: hypothetical protein OEY34_03040 [Cyclobacteriaceae bacterium]|nr:hypothetical protein [Cyclobacteriaceae bacterium]
MGRLIFKSLFFSFITFSAMAQLPNQAFYDSDSSTEAYHKNIFLKLNLLPFTKNNEYFNPIADGYTLFGYQANPSLVYGPTPETRIEAGVFLRKDFGAPGIYEIQPTFSFMVNHGFAKIIFGTLDSDLNHRLIEPLLDFEKTLVDPIENGMQIKMESESLFIDAWLEWETMIYKGDKRQEEMFGGISINKSLSRGNSKFEFPLQAIIYHKGGSIDANPNPLQTSINTGTGFVWNFTPRVDRSNQFSFYYVYYKDFSKEKRQTFVDGNGYYFNLLHEFGPSIKLMLSYWKGNEFISLMGGQLYPSVSSRFKRSWEVEPYRQLIILRFFHEIKINEHLIITSRFEPHIDLENGNFEFSNGFYINFREKFPLWKNIQSKRW